MNADFPFLSALFWCLRSFLRFFQPRVHASGHRVRYFTTVFVYPGPESLYVLEECLDENFVMNVISHVDGCSFLQTDLSGINFLPYLKNSLILFSKMLIDDLKFRS